MPRIFLLFLAIVTFGQSDISKRQALGCTDSSRPGDCKPCLRPGSSAEPGKETLNRWADVTALELNKSEVHIPTQVENEPTPGDDHSRDMLVEVTTKAEDPEGDVMTYHYTISGGRIVGQGSRVYWDLNGTRPGTYIITAAVDDGCGICGRRMTQNVTVTSQ